MCANPPRRKVRARGLVTHTLGATSPLPSASFAVQPMTGAFLCRQPPKAKADRPTGRPAAPPKKIGKKVRGAFDFAIWHGIVVSCSGKATRVNTTSPHSPNPHRRDSKRVLPVPASLLRRVLAAFPGHSSSFNSKSPPNRNDLGGLRSVLGAKR